MHGVIALLLPSILERLGIDRKTWLNNSMEFEQIYNRRFVKNVG
ncbi:MAG: hypothetical protein ACI89U_001752 [Gammaproteobacteria bacterium]|jgi:hypothetical protein